jgi:alkanesulfonate monooxygenase SsuD/methylene tetrahydromethanopterin reductase-like flavin-dependent oxidoreductase (luciferase family)
VVIPPLRNPLVLANQAASLDVLCGGRLLLGIGAGFLEPEMTAVGVPMAERGARTDEYFDAMRSLWIDPAPAYHGRYVSFRGVDAHPRPVRLGGLRVVISGSSPAAYRRAVTRGTGGTATARAPTTWPVTWLACSRLPPAPSGHHIVMADLEGNESCVC